MRRISSAISSVVKGCPFPSIVPVDFWCPSRLRFVFLNGWIRRSPEPGKQASYPYRLVLLRSNASFHETRLRSHGPFLSDPHGIRSYREISRQVRLRRILFRSSLLLWSQKLLRTFF